MNIQTLKGFRDFLPAEARKRQYVKSTLQKVFESYGFEPLETPTLEYEEILTGKYGDEGDKLMYRFKDNGDRNVAMRYDQTVPLARVIAQYQNELPTPFKRYQMQNVWRAENTQKGRFREFLQCDIDTIGTASNTADAEIIAVVAKSLEALGFKNYRILINDRTVFGELTADAIISIDKLKKIGEEKVIQELKQKGFSEDTLSTIKNAPMSASLREIKETAIAMGVNESRIIYEPTLARGLDYYTSTIIEIEIPEYPTGSVAGGGRYDNLIGMFGNKQIAAVGLAFGFDRIIEAMDELNLFPAIFSTAEILITIFNSDTTKKSMEAASFLRENNIATELWLDPQAKMEKQLKYANQKNIPFVLLLGPEEIEKNIVTLKNMKTREQQSLPLSEVISLLSSE